MTTLVWTGSCRLWPIMAARVRKLTRSAADFLPPRLNLTSLRVASKVCKGCDLYKHGMQTVFGEGPARAPAMFIGEVPGDQEDREGRPFVGPAGKFLDSVLEEVGWDRSEVYVTNAVKHFKWELRGKRRLHTKPSQVEVVACKAWLESEIFVVKPKLIVALGATAAQDLLGRDFRITRRRGELIPSPWAPAVMATYHPSAILRAPTPADREKMRREFVSDLRNALARLKE
jgi:uracil-DNA glycosylase